jgi:hypothetical protein
MTRRFLTLLGMAACAPGGVTPDGACRAGPPAEAVAPNASSLVALAGDYELTLVNSHGQYGDSLVRGQLRLWPNDSARRYAFLTPTVGRRRGERPLAGAFTSQSATVPSYPNRWHPGGPTGPAIEVSGQTLYFGSIDGMDGSGERLRITGLSAGGFWGTWAHEGGIESAFDATTGQRLREPSGHYCAVRLKHA